MKRYIVYNSEGKILRTGGCPKDIFDKQAHKGEFIIEGIANDVTQKVNFLLDIDSQPIDARVVNKTPEEIEADKPPAIPFEHKPANITNEQWQDVLNRLDALENSLDK